MKNKELYKMDKEYSKLLEEIKLDLKELDTSRKFFYELQKEKALIGLEILFRYSLRTELKFHCSKFKGYTPEECKQIQKLLEDTEVKSEILDQFKSYMTAYVVLDNDTIKVILLSILEDLFLEVLGVEDEDKEFYKTMVKSIQEETKELQYLTYRSNPLYKELAYFRGYEV